MWLVLANLCLYLYVLKGTDISVTTSNATGDYYIVSEASVSNYQYDTITCTASKCYVICDDVALSCYAVTIDASASDTLYVSCSMTSSCQTASIIGASETTYIYCSASDSCAASDSDTTDKFIVYASDSSDLYIDCTYGGSATTASACNYMSVNASNAQTVDIDCDYYDCYYSVIYVGNAQNVNIKSKATYSMQYMTVYGGNIGNELNVNCEYGYSCQYATIYCPSSSDCNVNCTTGYSCYDTHFYIADKFYGFDGLNCDDSDSTSCIYADLTCRDSGTSTILSYSSDWSCADYGCCPIRSGTINCDAGDDCTINCDGISCANYLINATLADSLDLNCSTSDGSGSGCEGAIILCPEGDDADCTITCGETDACQYAYVTVGDGNTGGSFDLECSATTACETMSIFVEADGLTSFDIICSGANSCDALSIGDIAATIDGSMSFTCGGANSCQDLTISSITSSSIGSLTFTCNGASSCYDLAVTDVDAGSIGAMNFYCLDSYACYNFAFTYVSSSSSDRSIGSLAMTCNSAYSCQYFDFYPYYANISHTDITCSGSYSCYYFAFQALTSTVDGLSLTCTGATYACYYMDLDAQVTGDVDIECTYTYACYSANINIDILNEETGVSIECDNLVTSTTYTGACYTSYFYVSSSFTNPDEMTNNVSLVCGTYDCYAADFYVDYMQEFSANCDDPYSCQGAIIDADTAQKLDLLCDASYSCYGTYVNCPYANTDSCKIVCETYSYVCYDMHITVPDTYLYGYLDITCPAASIYTLPCYSLDLICSGTSKTDTLLLYNTTTNEYECQYDTSSYCCDTFGGTVYTCDDGDDCSLTCDDYECDGWYIDASTADSLTLQCTGSYGCRDAYIYCPNEGDCTVNCAGYQGCYSAAIVYNGAISYGDTVTVNCYGSYGCYYLSATANYAHEFLANCYGTIYSCYYADFYGEYANYFNGTCTESQSCYYTDFQGSYAEHLSFVATDYVTGSNIYGEYAELVNVECISDQSYICHTLGITVTYATHVKIYCDELYSCYYINVLANYADKLEMTCRGGYACYYADVYAWFATNVDLSFTAKKGDMYASYESKFYLPPTEAVGNDSAVTIHCNGPGCYDIGIIYVNEDLGNIEWDINDCNQCSSQSTCINHFTVYCSIYSLGSLSYYEYAYWYSTYCTYATDVYNDCGCQDAQDYQVTYDSDKYDSECYNPSKVDDGSGSSLDIGALVGGLIGGCVGLVILIWCWVKCQQMQNRKRYNRPKPTPYVPNPVPVRTYQPKLAPVIRPPVVVVQPVRTYEAKALWDKPSAIPPRPLVVTAAPVVVRSSMLEQIRLKSASAETEKNETAGGYGAYKAEQPSIPAYNEDSYDDNNIGPGSMPKNDELAPYSTDVGPPEYAFSSPGSDALPSYEDVAPNAPPPAAFEYPGMAEGGEGNDDVIRVPSMIPGMEGGGVTNM